MNRKILSVLVIVVSLGTASCATWQGQSRTVKGSVYGTAAGAAAGSAIGAIVGGGEGAWKGAAIGAVVGGVGGGLMGGYMDKQAREMQAILAEQDRLRQDQESLHVSMSSDVMFDSGKASLLPGARDRLRRFSGVLNRYPRTDIEIGGHTDSRGTDEANDALSVRRAESVADELVANGVDKRRIRVRGEGESRPVATNETPEGRAQNRRVEVNVTADAGLRAEDAGGSRDGGRYEEPR